MSREIEFRAWHRDNSEMVYIDNDKAMTDPYIMQHLATLIAGKHRDGQIMQYTGLKDVRGVKIFERDVLKDNTNGCIWQVSFDDRGCFIAHDPHQILDCVLLDDYDFEVIGNIHQSPELLETTQ